LTALEAGYTNTYMWFDVNQREARRDEMRGYDSSTYASFEELERDEFRRMETLGASVEEMIEAIFGEEVRDSVHSYNAEDDED
jgi:hypothetical protein